MTARRRSDDFEADDFDEDDFDDEADEGADEDDDGLMPCPYCGAAIYEDSPRCPKCENYLSDAERTTTLQPRWIVVTAVVLLVVFALFNSAAGEQSCHARLRGIDTARSTAPDRSASSATKRRRLAVDVYTCAVCFLLHERP